MTNDKWTWVKSSYSGSQGGNCVEIAADRRGGVLVRDTKNREGTVLEFGEHSWRRFSAEVKAGNRRILHSHPGLRGSVRGRPPTGGRPFA